MKEEEEPIQKIRPLSEKKLYINTIVITAMLGDLVHGYIVP
jgi:hypothetical protein